MIGNDKFGFILDKKNDNNLEIKMIIDGVNIMEYNYNGEIRTTTWGSFNFINYFIDNLHHIMVDDPYPFESNQRNGIHMTRCSGIAIDWKKIELGDEKELLKLEECSELLDSWVQKHNWFYYRDAAFIPDVTFRRVNDSIEISWDNNELFDEEEVCYVNKEGCVFVDIDLFESTIKQLILEYKKILL